MNEIEVSILMGSDSDLPVMLGAAQVLEAFHVAHEVRIVSAHRTPERAAQLAREARGRGVKVIIAGAGMAAHLAGVVAAHTPVPVIGVPLRSEKSGLDGADALYATVQMPPGVPVASVGIGAAKNAAHLAVRILALSNADLARKLDDARREMSESVAAKDERLQQIGAKTYLQEKDA